MNNHYCKECGRQIPPKRVDLGYQTTCVEHSEVEKYSGFVVDKDVECYEIQIVKNPDIAREIQRLNKLY